VTFSDRTLFSRTPTEQRGKGVTIGAACTARPGTLLIALVPRRLVEARRDGSLVHPSGTARCGTHG